LGQLLRSHSAIGHPVCAGDASRGRVVIQERVSTIRSVSSPAQAVFQAVNLCIWRSCAMTSQARSPRRPPNWNRSFAEEDAFLKALDRKDAESRRRRTQKIVDEMADNATPESRITAAKARARAVHAQIDDLAAQTDLKTVQAAGDDSHTPSVPVDLADVRIDDFQTLFANREGFPPWFQERLKTINAKIHWQTKKGQKGFFNRSVHDNKIPLDKALTILAHIHGAHDGTGHNLDRHIDGVIECGLYPRIRKGKFVYGRRCQDGEHCSLCNYLNISDGLKVLRAAYDASAFYRGGNWFAITVAARTDPHEAKAIGRALMAEDWDRDNSHSAVYRESFRSRVFQYPDAFSTDDGLDLEVDSAIRRFLGAAQLIFGKLVKNGWLDGIRAKVENSVEFLPFASHQHWHGVGSSHCEHDPQAMADFIKEEVDEILAKTCPGLYADVVVAVIPTPEDLTRWINYINKTVDLVGAIASVYNRHAELRRGDPLFRQLLQELRLYPERSHRVFDMIRFVGSRERGAHTYTLRRRYVRGNHKFGRGCILTEPKRHRLWRKEHAEAEAVRRGNKLRADRRPKAKGEQSRPVFPCIQKAA
jgi:hypothetical protein